MIPPKLLINHRINTVEQLINTPQQYGVELDLRDNGTDIILHHDPFTPGEIFDDYLKQYKHQLIILNTKCEGLEQALIKLMDKHGITDYFFLDLSIPFLIKTVKNGYTKVAIRFSEYEPLEFVKVFEGKAEWVWVDCFTKNILTPEAYAYLKQHFKICIVSPELQGHPLEWINDFKTAFSDFEIDAICTKQPDLWK
jgi:hypothetical protein